MLSRGNVSRFGIADAVNHRILHLAEFLDLHLKHATVN